MMRVSMFLVVLLVAVGVNAQSKMVTHVYQAQLVRVVDGDTMDVALDMGLGVKMDVRIRIRDFDAPETWRPSSATERAHGEQATAKAIELLSKPFQVNSHGWAAYNRVEATVTLSDGRDFATVMKQAGLSKRPSY